MSDSTLLRPSPADVTADALPVSGTDTRDQHVARSAQNHLTDTAVQLLELHEQAVDPRLRALIDGAAAVLDELAATLTEHTSARVVHRF